MKRILKFLFSRIFMVSLLILLQLLLLFVAAFQFTEYFVIYYAISLAIAFSLTLKIVNRKDIAEYKIAWVATVLLIPMFGSALYVIFGANRFTKPTKKKMLSISSTMTRALADSADRVGALTEENDDAGYQAQYIANIAGCPLYTNTDIRYFPLGDDLFPTFLEQLRRAEKYIFLEYFIIAEGKMWDAVLEILREKAAAGVEVRVIYDDMGCIKNLPAKYPETLASFGIRCHAFNRFIPILSARLNNRNHRKIAVIDGKVAFTGGINLADEYINEVERFGHWKDNAVMLEGEAAWSMTVMFLTMWDYTEGCKDTSETYAQYRPPVAEFTYPVNGYVQPYADNPVDDEPVGKTIYLNMINHAKKYVYITTPYLIVDNILETALCNAAKCGVDVRIITPHIADKFFIHETTKSYYRHLIENGVKVYEYTPGFIHAKTFVCDDVYATVGTMNLDFRSLYLHFECGVWMYGVDAISEIKKDYMDTVEKSKRITEEDCRYGFWQGLLREVMVLIAPMI